MTELIDNPPQLPDTASLAMAGRSTEYIDGYEAGFDRGVAAGRNAGLDEAIAKYRAALKACVDVLSRLPWNEGYADEMDSAITQAQEALK